MTDSTDTSDLDRTSSKHTELGIPSWIVLVLLAVTPFLFATGFAQYEALKEYVLSAGIGLALVVWGVELIRRGRAVVVAGRVTMLAASFGLYVLLSIVWGSTHLYAAVEAIPFVTLVGIVLVLSAPLGRRIRFFDLALAVSVGAAAAGATGLLDLVGVEIFTRVWDPPGATGAFDAMEFATAYYAVALPLIIGAFLRFEGKSRYTFATCFLLAALHFGCVADWWAVGLLIGAGAFSGCLILLYEGTSTVVGLYPAAVLLGLVLLIKIVAFQAVGFPDSVNRSTSMPILDTRAMLGDASDEPDKGPSPAFSIGRIESVRTMKMRGYLSSVALDLFQDRPLLGRGPGAWWRMQTKYPNLDHPAVESRFQVYPAFRSPHNGWATLGIAFGAFGLAFFGLWLIAAAAVGLGALGREEGTPELVAEQWGFWSTAIAGGLFVTVTPLLELAPAAAVWVATVAFLTVRSAAINQYRGASVRWEWGDDASSSRTGRLATGAVAVLLGLAMIGGSTVDAVAKLYRGYGDHLMLRAYHERALDMYERADRWFPERGDVLHNIAFARLYIGTFDQAGPALDRALEMRPHDSRILRLRAKLHLEQKNLSKGLRLAKRAVNTHPNGLKARETLVWALQVNGRVNDAAVQLQKIIERKPPDEELAELHLWLGQIYATGLREFGQAKDHYEAAKGKATSSRMRKQVERAQKRLEKLKKGETPSQPNKGRDGKPALPPGMDDIPEEMLQDESGGGDAGGKGGSKSKP